MRSFTPLHGGRPLSPLPLVASDNRSRGKGAYVPLDNQGDLVENPHDWNKIIPTGDDKGPWSKHDVAAFQRLIDLRTLDLCKRPLTESGIVEISPAIYIYTLHIVETTRQDW